MSAVECTCHASNHQATCALTLLAELEALRTAVDKAICFLASEVQAPEFLGAVPEQQRIIRLTHDQLSSARRGALERAA
jgi:hypothetical protein